MKHPRIYPGAVCRLDPLISPFYKQGIKVWEKELKKKRRGLTVCRREEVKPQGERTL